MFSDLKLEFGFDVKSSALCDSDQAKAHGTTMLIVMSF